MKNTFFCLFLTFWTLPYLGTAQSIDPSLLDKPWKAIWITQPNANPNAYGVYYFRKSFELATKPNAFKIHVSADNRYKLFKG